MTCRTGKKSHHKIKRVMITGSEGYIGAVMAPMLVSAGYDVIGVDACFFAPELMPGRQAGYALLRKDIRDLGLSDLQGIDAVIHLAALSNDPLGMVNEQLTFDINLHASARLAEMARSAGAKRFLFASSCSLYGQGATDYLTEEDPPNPVTAYAKAKILAENELSRLATNTFSPVSLRNSTAYGLSPRLRVDLVVNNLAGFAKTTGKIQILGDGTPWRPLVHVADISRAFLAALEADTESIHNQAFNVGDNSQNFQVRTIAEEIRRTAYPLCEVTIAQRNSGDTRNYIVRFDKLNRQLGFRCGITLQDGIIELSDHYERIGLTTELFESPSLVRLKQIRQLMKEGFIDEQLRWRLQIKASQECLS